LLREVEAIGAFDMMKRVCARMPRVARRAMPAMSMPEA